MSRHDSNWHLYSREDNSSWPKDNDLYLVKVNKQWGGSKRVHFAEFQSRGWVPRDEPPVGMFDECVTHWHELPKDQE